MDEVVERYCSGMSELSGVVRTFSRCQLQKNMLWFLTTFCFDSALVLFTSPPLSTRRYWLKAKTLPLKMQPNLGRRA